MKRFRACFLDEPLLLAPSLHDWLPEWHRARDVMNAALISIGARPQFTSQAIEAARRIGKVDVDHGATGCKTPDVEPYILKMIERAKKS